MPRYSAPALEKGLDILELLAEQSDGLSQSQVAKALDRSPSELFRMLDALERRGYVRREADDLYRLTSKLFHLAHRHPPTSRLIETALPLMQRVAKAACQSCHLAVRHEDTALVAAQVEGPGFTGFTVRVGRQIPLVESCSGGVLLAFQPPEQRDEWLSDAGVGPRSAARKQVDRRLERIRKRGYEQLASPWTRGVTDVGYPLCTTGGRAVASLTVPFIEHRDGRPALDEVREHLAAAAADITNALGG